MNNAYEYVIKNGGIDTESDYSYCEYRALREGGLPLVLLERRPGFFT